MNTELQDDQQKNGTPEYKKLSYSVHGLVIHIYGQCNVFAKVSREFYKKGLLKVAKNIVDYGREGCVGFRCKVKEGHQFMDQSCLISFIGESMLT